MTTWLAWSEGRQPLFFIIQMIWVNFQNDLCHDDSIINIVPCIVIIIIIIFVPASTNPQAKN